MPFSAWALEGSGSRHEGLGLSDWGFGLGGLGAQGLGFGAWGSGPRVELWLFKGLIYPLFSDTAPTCVELKAP